VCVDWQAESRPRVMGPTFQQAGFVFTSLGQDPLRIVTYGDPVGHGKLAVPRKALEVRLPIVTGRVIAHAGSWSQEPVRMQALNAAQSLVGQAETSGVSGTIQELTVSGAGITTLLFTGGGGEGLLVDICVDDGTRPSPPASGSTERPPTTPVGSEEHSHGERRDD